MLNTIFLAVFRFFASILLVINVALSSPLLHGTFIIAQTSGITLPSEATPSEEPATSQASESSQTTQKRTPVDSKAAVEVQSKKASTPSTSGNIQSESGGPYDMESIKAFNRALYGS